MLMYDAWTMYIHICFKMSSRTHFDELWIMLLFLCLIEIFGSHNQWIPTWKIVTSPFMSSNSHKIINQDFSFHEQAHYLLHICIYTPYLLFVLLFVLSFVLSYTNYYLLYPILPDKNLCVTGWISVQAKFWIRRRTLRIQRSGTLMGYSWQGQGGIKNSTIGPRNCLEWGSSNNSRINWQELI